MTLVIETNLKNDDGTEKRFVFTSNNYFSPRETEEAWLQGLLDAKNAKQSIIIESTMIDTQYVTAAYIS